MVDRIERDAFIYLTQGKAPASSFAQCGPCRMFVPEEALGGYRKHDLCIIHGSNVEVEEGYSCGFMCQWPKGRPNPRVIRDHAAELKLGIPGSVTPAQSGLVDRQVRCENCAHFDADESACYLYRSLNEKLPRLFDLDDKVHPSSCCNAQTPIPRQVKSLKSRGLISDRAMNKARNAK